MNGYRFPRAALYGAGLALVCTLFACTTTGSSEEKASLMPINGTNLWVKRIGVGEPIIVVHGGPVLEHGYLVEPLAALSDRYELVFYDQRLSGRSDGEVPEESVRVATFVDDIEGLRQALGAEHVHLMGHSWGGLLAMRYAIRHTDRLRSLILLDSVAASSNLWQREAQALAERMSDEHKQAAQAIRESEDYARRDPSAIKRALLHNFRPQFHDARLVERLDLFVPDDYGARSAQFGAMMVDLREFDFHAELGAVSVPTLVLYGDREPSVELGGEEIHRHIEGSTFVVLQDAGHFPFIEQPDAFHRAVSAFLDSLKTATRP